MEISGKMKEAHVCLITASIQDSSLPLFDWRNPDCILAVTKESAQEICRPYEESKYLLDLLEGQEPQSSKHPADPTAKYSVVLMANAFSALTYLILVNDTFRNSFLVQMSHHKPSICGKAAVSYLRIKLIMPEKTELVYKS